LRCFLGFKKRKLERIILLLTQTRFASILTRRTTNKKNARVVLLGTFPETRQ
jgi:hypothetical protein